MRRRLCSLLSVALFVVAPRANAQPLTLDSIGSFAFRQTPAANVFDTAAKSLGLGVSVDSRMPGRMSLELNNVSIRTLLNAACESLGCRWRVEAGQLIVEPNEVRKSPGTEADLRGEMFLDAVNGVIPFVRLENQPLRSAVMIVAKDAGTGCRVSVPRDYPDNPVTLSATDVRLLDAIRQIFGAAGVQKVELAVAGSLASATGAPANCVIVALRR
ncbi:MAG: hypothetical protein R6V57_12620 [Vicinamibacterales bacterium]